MEKSWKYADKPCGNCGKVMLDRTHICQIPMTKCREHGNWHPCKPCYDEVTATQDPRDAQLSALREELGRANETVKKLAGFLEADHMAVVNEFGECEVPCEVCTAIKDALAKMGEK